MYIGYCVCIGYASLAHWPAGDIFIESQCVRERVSGSEEGYELRVNSCLRLNCCIFTKGWKIVLYIDIYIYLINNKNVINWIR